MPYHSEEDASLCNYLHQVFVKEMTDKKKQEQEKIIPEIYIPLRIRKAVHDSNSIDSEQWLSTFCRQAQNSYMILSEAGGGKSSFCQWLAQQLWHIHETDNAAPIPIIVPIGKLKVKINTITKFLTKKLKELLNDIPIDKLLKQIKNFPIILLLDGFDELASHHYPENPKDDALLKRLDLTSWNIRKLIITSRPEAQATMTVEEKRNNFQLLSPLTGSAPPESVYLQPFNDEQIEAYFTAYQNLRRVENNNSTGVMREMLNCLPDLKINGGCNPFVLSLLLFNTSNIKTFFHQNIEKDREKKKIIADKLEPAQYHHYTRLAIYQTFVERWINIQAEQLCDRTSLNREKLEEAANQLCKTIAIQLWKTGKQIIEIDFAREAREATGPSNPISLSSTITNISCLGFEWTTEYREEILNNTSASDVVEKRANAPSNSSSSCAQIPHQRMKAKLPEEILFNSFFQPEESYDLLALRCCPLRYLGEDDGIHRFEFFHKSILEYLACERMFSSMIYYLGFSVSSDLNEMPIKEHSVIQFCVDKVNQSPQLKAALWQLIQKESVCNERVAIAAGNALTILNAAGLSFSGQNFSHCRLFGANLSGALCIGTDFSHADLREINWAGAQLDHADFTGACLSADTGWGHEETTIVPAFSPSSLSWSLQIDKPQRTLLASGTAYCQARYHPPSIELVSLDQKSLHRFKVNHKEGKLSDYVVSKNGLYLAILVIFPSSPRSSISLCELKTGQLVYFFEFKHQEIGKLAISPNGEWLACAMKNGFVEVLEIKTQNSVQKFSINEGFHAQIQLSFSSDSQMLLVANSHAQMPCLQTYVVTSGMPPKSQQLVKNEDGDFITVLNTENPDACLLGHHSGFLKKITCEDNVETAFSRGHTQAILSLAYLPTNIQVLSGSFDQTVCLWNMDTLECLAKFNDRAPIISLAFSPLGAVMASNDLGEIKQWSTQPNLLMLKKGDDAHQLQGLAISPDGKWIITYTSDPCIQIWDTRTKRCLCTQTIDPYDVFNKIQQLVIAPSGQQIAIAHPEGGIGLWKVHYTKMTENSGNLPFQLSCERRLKQQLTEITGYKPKALLYSQNCTHLFALMGSSSHNDEKGEHTYLNFWDTTSGEALSGRGGALLLQAIPHLIAINSVDDERLIASSQKKGIFLYSSYLKAPQKYFSMKLGYFNLALSDLKNLSYCPEKKCVLASGYLASKHEWIIGEWSLDSGLLLKTYEGYSTEILKLYYGDAGKKIIAMSADNKIKVWDSTNGQCLCTQVLHSDFPLKWMYYLAQENLLVIATKVSVWTYRFQGKKLYLQSYLSNELPKLSANQLKLTNTYGLATPVSGDKYATVPTPALDFLQQRGAIGRPSTKSAKEIIETKRKGVYCQDAAYQAYFFSKSESFENKDSHIPSIFEIKNGFFGDIEHEKCAIVAVCFNKKADQKHAFMLIETLEGGYYRFRRLDVFENMHRVAEEESSDEKIRVELTDISVKDTVEMVQDCEYKAYYILPRDLNLLLSSVDKEQLSPRPYARLGGVTALSFTLFAEKANCISWCTQLMKKFNVQFELNGSWSTSFNDQNPFYKLYRKPLPANPPLNTIGRNLRKIF